MNRLLSLALLSLVNCLYVSAQTPAGKNKAAAIQPANQSVNTKTYSELSDTAVENRLVELALNGPEYRAATHQNKITELELKRAKSTWLNLLSLSTNYNDQSFSKQAAQTTLVYPKYFFGITIPLGVIFSQGSQVKAAREAVALGAENQEELSRKLKADILGKYKQYKLYTTLLEMQSELINDVLANATQAEESFKKGTITVELYIATQRTRNEEMAKNLNLKLQQDLLRLDIEKMIGVPLDQVLRPTRAFPNASGK
jgi:outer membrane protein TolC